MECTFPEHAEEDGRWRCTRCCRLSHLARPKPPRRQCRWAVVVRHAETCPLAAVVVRLTPHGIDRLTPHGIDRLQRCKASGCGELRTNSGTAICGRLSAKPCSALTRWAEFLNGDADCPHWITLPSDIPQPRLAPSL